jgi:hypothetical protein
VRAMFYQDEQTSEVVTPVGVSHKRI